MIKRLVDAASSTLCCKKRDLNLEDPSTPSLITSRFMMRRTRWWDTCMEIGSEATAFAY